MSLNNLKQKKCKSNKVNDLSDLIKWLSDLWKAKDCTVMKGRALETKKCFN